MESFSKSISGGDGSTGGTAASGRGVLVEAGDFPLLDLFTRIRCHWIGEAANKLRRKRASEKQHLPGEPRCRDFRRPRPTVRWRPRHQGIDAKNEGQVPPACAPLSRYAAIPAAGPITPPSSRRCWRRTNGCRACWRPCGCSSVVGPVPCGWRERHLAGCTARYYGVPVVSNNDDFDRVPGLRRLRY